MTYEQLQMNGLPKTESKEAKSPSYRQDFRVSRTALQEKVSGIVTAVTYGERLQECSEKLDRLGSSVKIRPVYLQGKISDSSEKYSMTLSRWGIASGGEFGELVMSERRTKESGCFCWLTPTAGDGERSNLPNYALAKHWIKKGGRTNLAEQIAYMEMFPTPQATSWGCSGARAKLKRLTMEGKITEEERKGMQAGNGGKLNPTWIEWLQGFPLGWTDLDASETR